jgi:HlyD family secretion protein
MARYTTHLALPLCLALAISACSDKGANDAATARAAASPRAVTAARVALRQMESELALSGVLVSREEAAVSSQLSGYPVARVLVDIDAQVQAGQPLAVLDDTLLRSDIAQQRAVLAQQRIAAERAQGEAARVTGLENSGVLSAEAIAERKLAARTAQAGVAQAQAALQALMVRQGLMTIRAPVSGRVLARTVRPGDIATTAAIMFRIERGNLVEVDAEVPEQSIARVRTGQRATVTLSSGLSLPATVRLVGAEIDPQTKQGRARVLMAPNRELRPGGFATVRLAVAAEDVPAVPEAALRHDASGTSIMVLDGADRVRTTPVRAGIHTDGWVALPGGPAPGTRVLTGGQSFVLDGDKVKPRVAQ